MEVSNGMRDNSTKFVHEPCKDRPSWDDTWLGIAKTMAKRSLCSRARVGAVIVDAENRPISMGYNGPPAGFIHENSWCSGWCLRGTIPHVYQQTGVIPTDPEYNDCPTLHAEQNALMFADQSTFTSGTIYVSGHVCGICAKLIGNSGLKRVVILDDGVERSYRNSYHWYKFLDKLGIKVTIVQDPDVILVKN